MVLTGFNLSCYLLQHYRISHFAFDDEYTNTILRVITIEKKQVNIVAEKLKLKKTELPCEFVGNK